ncbi:MAG: porin family protein [Tatlockia sp.]|nr:porin family protein [Tatlockia sp.]
MLRITKIVAVLSLLSASPCFSGLYLGAGFGPEGASFSQKSHVERIGTFNVEDVQHFAGSGVFGTLFAGYGWIINRLYLAAEANANISSVKYKLTNEEFIHGTFSKTTFTVKNSEGISILPGFFLSPGTLLYGRAGYANGRIKINESDPTIRSSSNNRDGFRYGFGLRHNFTPRWTFMMDYSQIHYKEIRSRVFEPMGAVLKNTRIIPNTAQVAFGIIFNFDVPAKVYVK